MRLDGKVAIVTGGSRGIGACIARRLASEGARVAVVANAARAKAEAVVQEIADAGGRAAPFQADVSRVADCEQLAAEVAEAFGTIDILVNNAGVYHPLPMEETAEALWDAQIDINLKGSFFTAKAVAPVMKAKGAGKIVNITSTLGAVGSAAGAAYCASKGGQMLLTKALCLELGPHGINVNAVAPGATVTDMNAAIRAQPGKEERMNALSPIGRYWAEADDMSGAVAYLVSDDAKAVHGAHLMIDHGWTAW
ncbi:MAG: glucose 1-dehydrogenase [Rhodospirillales bacterium]|nr:glucose 1-dehydrogenase [Rhodospirillales bacterium]MDE0381646.1 glucose 1-dehydrogenase [Rhodospirillales bacterium]